MYTTTAITTGYEAVIVRETIKDVRELWEKGEYHYTEAAQIIARQLTESYRKANKREKIKASEKAFFEKLAENLLEI